MLQEGYDRATNLGRHARDRGPGKDLTGRALNGPTAGKNLLLPDLELGKFRLIFSRSRRPPLDLLDPALNLLQTLERTKATSESPSRVQRELRHGASKAVKHCVGLDSGLATTFKRRDKTLNHQVQLFYDRPYSQTR